MCNGQQILDTLLRLENAMTEVNDDKLKEQTQQLHRSHQALLALVCKPEDAPFPDETVWGKEFTMWRSDIGATVAAELGTEEWASCRNEADKLYGNAGGQRKNSPHIEASLAFV